MRSLVLALALCSSVAAQPTAADSALVDRLVDGLRLELGVEAMDAMADSMKLMTSQIPGGMGGAMASAFRTDLDDLEDAVRASLLEDVQPELIREAIAFLDGPTYNRLMEALPMTAGTMGPQQMLQLAEDTGDRPMADSALSVRYARAMFDAAQSRELQRASIDLMIESMPASVASFFDQMGGLESLVESSMSDEMQDLQLSMTIPALRVALADVDEDDILAVSEFYESEAGKYVIFRSGLGSLRLQMPAMMEAMAPMFSMLNDTVKEAVSAVQSDAPRVEDGVFEVVETMPEMIGGLEGLQSRVVYPESARREDVEGQVVVQFVVSEDGTVRDLEVLRSPDERLSEAALEAVRASRFKPGRNGGKPVAVRFALPVTFRLQ